VSNKKYMIIAATVFIVLITVGFFVRHTRWKNFYRDYPKGKIRIELQNGTPIEGFAFKMTKIFRYHGFDVVDFSNADSKKFKKTVIIDLRGSNPELKILQSFLHTDECYTIYSERAEREGIDAIVILGSDLLDNEVFQDSRYSGRIIFDEKSTNDRNSSGR